MITMQPLDLWDRLL